MEFLTRLILLCLLFLAKVNATDYSSEPFSPIYQIDKFNRSSFPTGFSFGASSSAYQVNYLLLISCIWYWLFLFFGERIILHLWFDLFFLGFTVSNRLKVHGILTAKDLAFGIPSHINFQVYIKSFKSTCHKMNKCFDIPANFRYW